jgi:outer membrane biosynthesis protein TonB
MAKVTWLGEDTATTPGPSFNTWNGIKFPKGKAVEVTDAHMLAKAKANRFYKVAEQAAPKPEKVADGKVPETADVPPAPETPNKTGIKAKDPKDYPPVKKKVKKPKARAAAGHAHR